MPNAMLAIDADGAFPSESLPGTGCEVDAGSHKENAQKKEKEPSSRSIGVEKGGRVPAAPGTSAFANLTNTGVDSKLAHKHVEQ